MFDKKGRIIIEKYRMKSPFASFLPGISGVFGIPVWSFYVNRGQAISSFGSSDKDHSIMEFYPAHQAYQNTEILGFRTFLRVNNEFVEPFHESELDSKMYIGSNELEIEDYSRKAGIKTNVLYYTLPEESLGALIRQVSFHNMNEKSVNVECIDGMPAVVPYGIELDNLKNMGQTMKAWMQVEDSDLDRPYYRVKYSTNDSTCVEKIHQGNFILGRDQSGDKLHVVVDPEMIFAYDTSLLTPVVFKNGGLQEVVKGVQCTKNSLPCGMICKALELQPGEIYSFYEIIGQAENKKILEEYSLKKLNRNYFDNKYIEAGNLTDEIGKKIDTHTGAPLFDAYCRQTFIDNVLRGGTPVKIGGRDTFYVYSRKHGDLERDYNYFVMKPEFYTQGNGNYRDINQNRRNDVMFYPWINDFNVKLFYQLVQLDGYNPLILKPVKYTISEDDKIEILNVIETETENNEESDSLNYEGTKNDIREFLNNPFTPGELYAFSSEKKIRLKNNIKFTDAVLDKGKISIEADFSEGYWIDHWTYNIDLIMSYLNIYPEREEELLFMDTSYAYYRMQADVLPRRERYVKTDDGIRQYNCLKKRNESMDKWERLPDGRVYYSSLMTKLLLMAVTKVSTIDICGMGIEMEAGKPGWYDALNGLPGILGSSMAETYELKRMLKYMIRVLEKYRHSVAVPTEVNTFIKSAGTVLDETKEREPVYIWDRMNCSKEEYRKTIEKGLSGYEIVMTNSEIIDFCEACEKWVDKCIERAESTTDELTPLYFFYDFKDYICRDNDYSVVPVSPIQKAISPFLEGVVHRLKITDDKAMRMTLYKKVRESGLYDKILHMYKVNSPLNNVPFEAGRATAFTPGWLENESVWLHMEYKYILEVMRSGMYHEFFDDLKNAVIPFLDENIYGRSLLENSSFIVSSANENKKIWGKGFVARLSGATAEFLQIWYSMMFGLQPFVLRGNKLYLELEPIIPSYLLTEDNSVSAMFTGDTRITYHFSDRTDIIPGEYEIESYQIKFRDGQNKTIREGCIGTEEAILIRNGHAAEIEVTVKCRIE
jgi:hypothetical protein